MLFLEHYCRSRRGWSLTGIVIFMICLAQLGCVQNLMMLGKVLVGDPIQKSALEQAASVNLKKSQKKILVYCSAPAYVADKHGPLTSDVQEELVRRMRRHQIQVLKSDSAAEVLDSLGGQFDPKILAREIPEVDYITHIRITAFDYLEPSSPNLYRGRCEGNVVVFEVRGTGDDRHTVQVMDQQFQTSYPSSYPVPVDQTPKNVFLRECVDHIADTLGSSFYNVNHHSLFAN